MNRIGDYIAEEAQLLAEERWIINALNKLKQQRNSLQIERLQLENVQTKLHQKIYGSKPPENPDKYEDNEPSTYTTVNSTPSTSATVYPMPSTSATVNPMPSTSATVNPMPSTSGGSRNNIQFEEPLAEVPAQTMDLDACDNEELDLAVSKSAFSNEFKENMLEEDEEEEDDDDMIMIDMNMFMNSKASGQ